MGIHHGNEISAQLSVISDVDVHPMPLIPYENGLMMIVITIPLFGLIS
jgi:hypothetical protein